MRSGVDAPVFGELRGGDNVFDEEPIVVDRCMLVVSAEGGAGRFWRCVRGERIEARQRKHSPVPK